MTTGNMRESLAELENFVSRRGFVRKMVKGAAGLALAFDRLGPSLFGADVEKKAETRVPYLVYSAIGNLVIPVDEDPGWSTFEPGITDFGMNVFVAQVLLGGNPLAFGGFLGTMVLLNQAPVVTSYGPEFLSMTPAAQNKYYGDILIGQFENDGFGDPLAFASGLSLISTKAVFFSNYPNHRAVPGAEFQVRTPSAVKTGWDIMKLKGPVGPDEEKALRAKYFDAPELPGVDLSNIYI